MRSGTFLLFLALNRVLPSPRSPCAAAPKGPSRVVRQQPLDDGKNLHWNGKNFYWAAIAGAWSPLIRGRHPKGFRTVQRRPDAQACSSQRPFEMGRPSLLQAKAEKKDGVVITIHIGGRCVPVMSGTIDRA